MSEAAGVPSVLTRPESDGTGRREAYRQFVASSLRPLLDQIEVVASELLEVEVRISAERLAGADLASRARVPCVDRQGRQPARRRRPRDRGALIWRWRTT